MGLAEAAMVLLMLQGYPPLAHLLRGSPKSSPCCFLQNPIPHRGGRHRGLPRMGVGPQGVGGGGRAGALGRHQMPRADRRTGPRPPLPPASTAAAFMLSSSAFKHIFLHFPFPSGPCAQGRSQAQLWLIKNAININWG